MNIYHTESETPERKPPEIKNVHILFRKTFFIENLAVTSLSITADDYYTLYVNGKFVTQGPATAYHFCQNINEVDITPYLKTGENTIAVHCFYSGYINRIYNSGDLRIGMYAEASANGKILFTTDESWKYAFDKSFLPTDITWGYDTQAPENRDMRLFPHGWTEIGFDDSGWENAVIKTDDDHVCVEQVTPNVHSEEFSFRTVAETEKGFLLDFGEEIVGRLSAKLCGTKGNKVRVMFGEELGEGGHVRHKMRCGCDYDEEIILSGKADTAENFEYKGFRYIEVETEEESVRPENFSVIKRNYPVKKKTSFSSNVKLLNDIWKICENAVIISSQEVFVDCPTREKGQYLGDMTVTALAHTYITGDPRLYKKALIDFANTAFITDGLLAVAPGGFMQEIADFSLLYPLQLKNYYNLTGDTETVSALLETAEKAVEHFRKFERSDGLLDGVSDKWNLVDWPDNLRDNYDFELTKPIGKGVHNVINAYYFGAKKNINELRTMLGYAPKYELESHRDAFIKVFYRDGQGLFADSETSEHCNFHSNVLPLYFGITNKSFAENAVRFIMKKGLCCGVFFSYFVLKALAQYGYFGEVYSLITNDSPKSWKNMVDEGATAVFEAWGKDQKWNTSLCHPWGSAPVISIIEDLMGYKFTAGKLTRDEVHLPEGVSIELNLV